MLVAEAREVYLASLDINDGEIGEGWYVLGARIAALHLKCKNAPEFEEHCQTIGISPRTGYYIIQVYQVLRRLRIQPPAGISWRKLAEIIPVLQWKNHEKLFRLCREHPQREIIEIVKNWKR